MPIPLQCASCRTRMRAPNKTAGSTLKCPKCGAALIVPLTIEALDTLAKKWKQLIPQDSEIDDTIQIPCDLSKSEANAERNSSLASEWFCQRQGKIAGPFTSKTLKRMVAEVVLLPEDMVKKRTDGVWVRASRVKGLFETQTQRTWKPVEPPVYKNDDTLPMPALPDWLLEPASADTANKDNSTQESSDVSQAVSEEQPLEWFSPERLPQNPTAKAYVTKSEKDATEYERCFFCDALIKQTALECTHCGEFLGVVCTALPKH